MMHDVVVLMHDKIWFFLLTVGLVGLAVGSFLNVVIYRLPKMMHKEWQSECRILLGDELKKDAHPEPQKRFNLVTPASTCPKCKNKIKPWHNIPVISWLLLKGRCAYCDAKISVRYPLIEFMTALLSLAVAWHFGVTELTPSTWSLPGRLLR